MPMAHRTCANCKDFIRYKGENTRSEEVVDLYQCKRCPGIYTWNGKDCIKEKYSV